VVPAVVCAVTRVHLLTDVARNVSRYARFMDLSEVEQALAIAELLPKEGGDAGLFILCSRDYVLFKSVVAARAIARSLLCLHCLQRGLTAT
jgi:hypothetical protein